MNQQYEIDDGPIQILGVTELLEIAKTNANALAPSTENTSLFDSQLASHIVSEFQINKNAKQTSGAEQEILSSLRQYNGEYERSDLAKIKAQGGSSIYMNISSTKCRAASSWIRDILQAANAKPWTILPTPDPELPKGISSKIDQAITEEFQALVKEVMESEKPQEEAPAQAPPQGQPPVEGQPQPAPAPAPEAPKKTKADKAQSVIREINQSKRDIKDAIYNEIEKEAKWNCTILERKISDQLVEGNWDEALSDFIDNFTIFPTAIFKGPIVTKQKRLKWENGNPVESNATIYMNKNISPMDVYPAPQSDSPQAGTFIEHLRLFPSEVYGLIGVPTYRESEIRKVLREFSDGQGNYAWIDTAIEDEKADQERKGNQTDANRGIIHGMHFFGAVSGQILKDWGVSNEKLDSGTYDPEALYEVEAILIGNTVIKCELNDDPLLRRPYYIASYQRRPGAFWGRSLPQLMESVQRMCNAAARALSNNMALASGPQIEIYVDRLADNGDVQNIKPFHVWQLTSDPTGGGGRAIQFYQPTSNAQELLAVYDKFEEKADDATGIPRYAYGNEKVQGAAATATGLSMLLETASKGIKDAIRNIDRGLIVKRIEHQFYHLMTYHDVDYTGDVTVKALGSSALTLKGAELLRRQEFLQATGNEFDQNIMGVEGRTALLREMSKDLGFTEDIVPTRLDVKKAELDKKEAQAQAGQMKEKEMAMELEKSTAGAKIQIEGQKEMNALTQKIKMLQEENKKQNNDFMNKLKAVELQIKDKEVNMKAASQDKAVDTKATMHNKELAIKITEGEGI